MDINKVDLLLNYILATAGQEDYGNRESSKNENLIWM